MLSLILLFACKAPAAPGDDSPALSGDDSPADSAPDAPQIPADLACGAVQAGAWDVRWWDVHTDGGWAWRFDVACSGERLTGLSLAGLNEQPVAMGTGDGAHWEGEGDRPWSATTFEATITYSVDLLFGSPAAFNGEVAVIYTFLSGDFGEFDRITAGVERELYTVAGAPAR